MVPEGESAGVRMTENASWFEEGSAWWFLRGAGENLPSFASGWSHTFVDLLAERQLGERG